MERRGQAIRVMINLVNWQQEEPTDCGGERQLSMDGTSRVSREAQARICERLGVRFPGATRPSTEVEARTRVGSRQPALPTARCKLRFWPSSNYFRHFSSGSL